MNSRYLPPAAVIALVVIGGVVIAQPWLANRISYLLGATPLSYSPLPAGDSEVPTKRTKSWNSRSALSDQVVGYWADKPLSDWKTDGKIAMPRALLARFFQRRNLDEANAYLQSVGPWGRPGSTWALHRNGDYDFTMAGLVPILFLFGDDPEVLYPETCEHILNSLLPLEGGEPQLMVPRTLGLVRETENHLLMAEGSRYLKNRWLALHGSNLPIHDNAANGLEAWLLNLIHELRSAGLYEFNSIPYAGYTLTALLNLEAFGSEELRDAARGLIDDLNWRYALSSLSYRCFPPFRRRYSYADHSSLNNDRQTALAKVWMSLLRAGPDQLKLNGSAHIALWACWSPYRLPDQTVNWIQKKPTDYFVRMGHGKGGSPEIYSGGPGYLLSAGGVNRGRRSMIIARPITLLLEDKATRLSQILYLAGPGKKRSKWNNTGVWHHFAVTSGPVYIPPGWKPEAEGRLWKVYKHGGLCVAVYSEEQLGVVYLVCHADSEAVLEMMEKKNGDAKVLMHSFLTPDETCIAYEVNAPQDCWVIKQINGRAVDRNFDGWPLIRMESTPGFK